MILLVSLALADIISLEFVTMNYGIAFSEMHVMLTSE